MMTFEKQPTPRSSAVIQWNVSLHGKPFGAIFTYKDTDTDKSPWTAKPLNGETEFFWAEWHGAASKVRAFEKAKAYMESLA